MQSGSCQALILDVPIIEAQNAKQPGAYGGVVGQIDTHEGYGAVFAKNSPLIPDVSKAINKLQTERDDQPADEAVVRLRPGEGAGTEVGVDLIQA